MKVVGLDGRDYTWNFQGNLVKAVDIRERSTYHVTARELIVEKFPSYRLMEEVAMPGSKTAMHNQLVLDFFLPNLKLAIEVHGEQHYKFVRHFHGTKKEFTKSKVRDLDKHLWCSQNNIQLVVLPYSETEDEWRSRLVC